jgi:hypothetical protein
MSDIVVIAVGLAIVFSLSMTPFVLIIYAMTKAGEKRRAKARQELAQQTIDLAVERMRAEFPLARTPLANYVNQSAAQGITDPALVEEYADAAQGVMAMALLAQTAIAASMIDQ